MHTRVKCAAWLRGISSALPWDYILLSPAGLPMDSFFPSFTTQQVLGLVSQAVNPNPLLGTNTKISSLADALSFGDEEIIQQRTKLVLI